MQFAGYRHGKVFHKPDIARDLEVGQGIPAEVTDFMFGGSLTGVKFEPGHNFLTVVLIWHAKDCHLGNLSADLRDISLYVNVVIELKKVVDYVE